MKKISYYKTIVFDCDGVVLNSNKVKTQAFYEATKHFGHDASQALVDYHVANGGISRYAKAKYFISDILQQEFDNAIYQDILYRFAQEVINGLMNCDIVDGLSELKAHTADSNWLIVSGGDQNELREIFSNRDLDHYFDGGIFGSPDNKDFILERERANGNIAKEALFVGDSKYDFKAANSAELDFVFVSDWTEVKDWSEWAMQNNLVVFPTIQDLLTK